MTNRRTSRAESGGSLLFVVLFAVGLPIAISQTTPSPGTAVPVAITAAPGTTTSAPAGLGTTPAPLPFSTPGTGLTPAPLTPSPSADTVALFDIVFKTFMEEESERTNILRVIQNALNISEGRIDYNELSPTKKGFLFGFNVIVRFKIIPATSTSPRLAKDVRQSLLTLYRASDSRLTNIDVVSVIAVPDSPSVPRYQSRTTWDVLYTLVIIAGGLLFCGFLVFIIYKLVLMIRRSAEEARLAEEDRKDGIAPDGKKGAEVKKETKRKKKGQEEEEEPSSMIAERATTAPPAPWELPDEDETSLINELSAARSRPGLLVVPSAHVIDQQLAARLKQQEQFLNEFELPPESAPLTFSSNGHRGLVPSAPSPPGASKTLGQPPLPPSSTPPARSPTASGFLGFPKPGGAQPPASGTLAPTPTKPNGTASASMSLEHQLKELELPPDFHDELL
jgi:hypothetical protein